MKIISVVGARPQFIKVAPIHEALVINGHEHLIVHTGQHYDASMSANIFIDLGLPEPKINLNVGSGSHAEQTAKMLIDLEKVFLTENPDIILLYGDTNSTIAGALAAAKIHIPIAHLEAGLRSGNKLMPEEHNRIVTDHLSSLALAPTQTAVDYLRSEGLEKITQLVGDVMVDICLSTLYKNSQQTPTMPKEWDKNSAGALATIHRAENTSSKERLGLILSRLNALNVQVQLVAHPRLVSSAKEFGLDLSRRNISIISPLTYTQMIYAMKKSICVVTDSGGLQKEAFISKIPCITVRTETEWPETLEGSWNVISTDLDIQLSEFLGTQDSTINSLKFGDGKAARRAVAALESFVESNKH